MCQGQECWGSPPDKKHLPRHAILPCLALWLLGNQNNIRCPLNPKPYFQQSEEADDFGQAAEAKEACWLAGHVDIRPGDQLHIMGS